MLERIVDLPEAALFAFLGATGLPGAFAVSVMFFAACCVLVGGIVHYGTN